MHWTQRCRMPLPLFYLCCMAVRGAWLRCVGGGDSVLAAYSVALGAECATIKLIAEII